MNHSTPGLPVHHQLPEFTQTHVRRVGDAIQPSHPLSSPSPPAPNPSQHQAAKEFGGGHWRGRCSPRRATEKPLFRSRALGSFFHPARAAPPPPSQPLGSRLPPHSPCQAEARPLPKRKRRTPPARTIPSTAITVPSTASQPLPQMGGKAL